jgi:SAM-dependent methyltransferase
VGGADLYRTLQEHKTDDLEAIAEFLDTEHRRLAPNGTRLALTDLCSGIGRTVHLYAPHLWDVTCVDIDPVALTRLAATHPGVDTVQADLSAPVELPAADVIVCAHHAANETGELAVLLGSAARALRSGGALLIDILTANGVYPFAWHRETVRTLVVAGQRHLLETTVMPTAHPGQHYLLLYGTPLHSDGTRDDAETARTALHFLPRRVFTSQEVQATAERSGLRVRSEDRGRFTIEKPPRR